MPATAARQTPRAANDLSSDPGLLARDHGVISRRRSRPTHFRSAGLPLSTTGPEAYTKAHRPKAGGLLLGASAADWPVKHSKPALMTTLPLPRKDPSLRPPSSRLVKNVAPTPVGRSSAMRGGRAARSRASVRRWRLRTVSIRRRFRITKGGGTARS